MLLLVACRPCTVHSPAHSCSTPPDPISFHWPGPMESVSSDPVFLFLEPALGFDGGHAPRAGGGDRLAVEVVLDVSAGEYPLDVGAGAVEGADVAVVPQLQLALEQRRVGLVPDGHEQPGDVQGGGFAGGDVP